MNNYSLIAAVILFPALLLAQPPQAIQYQAVARDAYGLLLAGQDMDVRISILRDNAAGTAVYQEKHAVTTSDFGLINLAIGTGTVLSGDFEDIAWGSASHYVKLEVDTSGSDNYTDLGTTQLLSVPYSLDSDHAWGLFLHDANGNEYEVLIDTSGLLHAQQTGLIPWACGDSLTDARDGQKYPTVQIGTQCWMAENMNVGMMIPSTGAGSLQTDNGSIEKYCFSNIADSCNTYGGLYEWNEAMQYSLTESAQGICMQGWHIPSDSEWTVLADYLGGPPLAGGKMKSTGTIMEGTGLWQSPNTNATNESGFTGLPGGYRHNGNGDFYALSTNTFIWSSSEIYTTNAWDRYLGNSYGDLGRHNWNKMDGFSVRCLMD